MSFVRHAEQHSVPHSLPGSRIARRAPRLCDAPDDLGCESVRLVVNAAIDRRPALIVRPVDSADMSLAVSVGRAHGIDLPSSAVDTRRSRHIRRWRRPRHAEHARATHRPAAQDA
jgi:hypothetical protein